MSRPEYVRPAVNACFMLGGMQNATAIHEQQPHGMHSGRHLSHRIENGAPSVAIATFLPEIAAMQHVLSDTNLANAGGAGAAPRYRPATSAEELYEFRTFSYTKGWDEDDAELGWVDEDVVRGSRRLH